MFRSVGAVLLAGALVVIGSPADADGPAAPVPPLVTRRVDIEMRDVAFAPTALDVKLGETVTFVFKNTGTMVHDAFVGDRAAQDHHEKEMRSMTDPNDHHSHEGGVTVHPGETGALRYFFDKPGALEIGCHQLGHYALGMKVVINVSPGVPSVG
jgi:uncharacterized cupredoxin-like copper-binding protein